MVCDWKEGPTKLHSVALIMINVLHGFDGKVKVLVTK